VPTQNAQAFSGEDKSVPLVGPAQGENLFGVYAWREVLVNCDGEDLFLAQRFARHVSPLTTTV